MAASTTDVMIVAQAEGGDALQEGLVVEDAAAEGAEEAVEHAIGAEDADHADDGEHATEGAHEGEVGHETGVFPPFNPDYFAGQLIWLALTFGFLYVLISRAAIPRISGILDQRRVRIEGDLKEADRLRLETDKALADYEAALAEARSSAHAIAEETRASIRADIEGKRAAVEADLSKKVAAAEAAIAGTKAEALANVDEIAADTAAALVAQLGGKATAAAARKAVTQAVKG